MLKKRYLAEKERASNPSVTTHEVSHITSPKHPSSPPLMTPPTYQQPPPVQQQAPPQQRQQAQHHKPQQPVVSSKTRWMPGSALCTRPSQPKLAVDLSTPMPEYNERGEKLYCICRKPYNPQAFMIACDQCNDWFHGRCVKIAAATAKALDKYICPLCLAKNNKRKADTAALSEHPKRAKPSSTPVAQPLPTAQRDPSPDAHSDNCEAPLNVPSSSERRDNDSSSSSPLAGSPSADKTATLLPPMQPLNLGSSGVPNTPDNVTVCAFHHCSKPAASGSKYCGDACGLQAARLMFQQRTRLLSSPDAFCRATPLSPVLRSMPPLSPAIEASDAQPRNAEANLQSLLRQQESVSSFLTQISQKLDRLNAAIERANQAFENPAARLCGCPLDSSLVSCDSVCTTLMTECVQHAHWQTMIKSDLLQERILYDKALSRLKVEESVLRAELGC